MYVKYTIEIKLDDLTTKQLNALQNDMKSFNFYDTTLTIKKSIGDVLEFPSITTIRQARHIVVFQFFMFAKMQLLSTILTEMNITHVNKEEYIKED